MRIYPIETSKQKLLRHIQRLERDIDDYNKQRGCLYFLDMFSNHNTTLRYMNQRLVELRIEYAYIQ